MKTYSFPEIADLDHQMPIPRFEGKVTRVYEQKTGIGDFGDWYLQNMIVEDQHANRLSVTWCGADDMSLLEGRRCSFESHQTDKGLTGIKKDIRTYNGKKYEGVKLTESCKIHVLDGEGIQQARDEALPATASREDTSPPKPTITSNFPILDARQRAIIRQHSQSMAVEVLKLKQALNELTLEDLTPAKLRQLADYFDKDVDEQL